MNEIELKAWVHDRAAVTKKLEAFARRTGKILREDEYYSRPETPRLKLRIRHETTDSGTRHLVTYKRKKMVTSADGTAAEVNDEKESEILSPEVLLEFLKDTGHELSLKKTKEVEDWEADGTLVELCSIPELGDFAEIEILSESNDAQTISRCMEKLAAILEKCGIGKEYIENRTYSQLLEEARQRGKKCLTE